VLLLAGSLRVLTLPGPPDEECPPGLRGRGAPLEEQPGDGAFGHVMPSLSNSPWIRGRPRADSPRPFA
jgi:hypothetical protein